MKFGQNILPFNRVNALSHAVLLRKLNLSKKDGYREFVRTI